MKIDKQCPILDQYLAYLSTIKGCSQNTTKEYNGDLLSFFRYIALVRNINYADYSFVDIEFIKSITLSDMYAFMSYCQFDFNSSTGTKVRKIVSIRQFRKHLKTKSHLIENNIAEELETPKLPKRITKYLNLEESVRLLIESKSSVRDNCILTIFLNCALRLSELASLNVDRIQCDAISVHKLRHTAAINTAGLIFDHYSRFWVTRAPPQLKLILMSMRCNCKQLSILILWL